jgi:hypothetical protein
MSRTHTIRVAQDLEALGVELASFTADITVNLIPTSGDGWNEPRELACAELMFVTQFDGPHIQTAQLTKWAELWVDANQDRIWSDVRASEPF